MLQPDPSPVEGKKGGYKSVEWNPAGCTGGEPGRTVPPRIRCPMAPAHRPFSLSQPQRGQSP